ncbi:MAG: hypothetical protein ACPHCN_18800 [Mycobacterium sp.]
MTTPVPSMPNLNFIDLVRSEPVLFLGIVEAIVFAVTEFGIDLTGGQQAAVLGLVAAVLSFITRSTVTPAINLEA